MKPIANFDAEGRLVRLHFQPTESCNTDDAEDKRELTWAEAFLEVHLVLLGLLLPEYGSGIDRLRVLLCQHCMGDEE